MSNESKNFILEVLEFSKRTRTDRLMTSDYSRRRSKYYQKQSNKSSFVKIMLIIASNSVKKLKMATIFIWNKRFVQVLYS